MVIAKNHFLTLKSLNNIPITKFDIYADKLAALHGEFKRIFGDFDTLEKKKHYQMYLIRFVLK